MIDVTVPDIGDFTDVPIVEVLVSVGDDVGKDDPLVVLESDKASMEIPAPEAGKIAELLVKVGDTVSEGSVIAKLDGAGADGGASAPSGGSTATIAVDPPLDRPEADVKAQVVVIGSGPGGYTAAFRAADLGLDVILVERDEVLGGVCLNVGCIPSKALLHVAKVIAEAAESAEHGVSFGEPEIDIDRVRSWKEEVVGKLTGGLTGLAKRRKVRVVNGTARFTGAHTLDVDGTSVAFDHAIIAVGSRPVSLPDFPEDERIIDSTGALELAGVPERLLVIGGGIIGLEMATVYDALGAKVTVVELMDQLIPGCDPDLVKPLHQRIGERYAAIHLGVKVEDLKAKKDGVHATLSSGETGVYDRVLVAVGRRPNVADVGADAAGVEVDERGFIRVDERQRTNVPHIYAIGDVVGDPMLAHKATHEGVTAAEVIAGHDVTFDARSIPSVAYTDPEVAWTGLTETRAKEEGIEYELGSFPWAASGRALSLGRAVGTTKLLVDPESRRILGAGMVGTNAGELLAEVVLALEMGADAQDVALTIHPHPTLSETIGFAAEAAEGTITDLMPPRRKKR